MTTKTEGQIQEAELDRKDNDTNAASSIQAHPTGATSKLDIMTKMLGAAGGMTWDDLTHWYEQMIAQIGHEADSTPGSADANRATVNMKPSHATGTGPWNPSMRNDSWGHLAKEEVEGIFAGQDLSEEFKDKAKILFEAAVNGKVILEMTKLQEETEKKFAEEVEATVTALVDKVDEYLTYIAEEWMKSNEVAIDRSLRTEIVEDFVVGIVDLAKQHNVVIPEGSEDIIATLTGRIEELEEKLNEQITTNIDLSTVVKEHFVSESIAEAAEGLNATQTEKFKVLAEGVEFEGDPEVYAKKLKTVREHHFPVGGAKKPAAATGIMEETGLEEPVKDPITDPDMRKYASALSRTVNKTF